MNLFQKNLDNSKSFLESGEYISDNVMGGISKGKAEILNNNNKSF